MGRGLKTKKILREICFLISLRIFLGSASRNCPNFPYREIFFFISLRIFWGSASGNCPNFP